MEFADFQLQKYVKIPEKIKEQKQSLLKLVLPFSQFWGDRFKISYFAGQ